MSAKTKWVRLRLEAYAFVAIEVPDGTPDEMREYADRIVFDGHCDPSYELDETAGFEVLKAEPSVQFCLRNDIDRCPMDDDEREELAKKQAEGGAK